MAARRIMEGSDDCAASLGEEKGGMDDVVGTP
jgi:hypothetical protein